MTLEPSAAALLAARERERGREGGREGERERKGGREKGREGGRERDGERVRENRQTCVAPAHPLQQLYIFSLSTHCPSLSG